MVFKVAAEKWEDDGTGTQTLVPVQDWVQVAVLDGQKRIISRKAVFTGPDEPPVRLALGQNAAFVAVDPLGTLPDLNRRNNLKRLLVN